MPAEILSIIPLSCNGKPFLSLPNIILVLLTDGSLLINYVVIQAAVNPISYHNQLWITLSWPVLVTVDSVADGRIGPVMIGLLDIKILEEQMQLKVL